MFVMIAALALSPQRMHHHSRARAQKAAPVDEQKAIRALGAKVTHCFETKNYSLFRSTLTSNFQQELPNHKVLNLRQVMAGIHQALDPITDLKAGMDIQQIKVDGNTAVVDDRYNLSGKMTDKKGTHKVVVLGSETVSLKKVRGQWLAYYLKTHDESVSMNGHIVSHMP